MIKWSFYLTLVAFVIFLIIIFIHYTIYPIISFSPGDGGIIPLAISSDVQNAYKNELVPSDAGTEFKNMNSCSYSVEMDVFLYGTFHASQTPRVLFYRGTAPVTTDFTREQITTTFAGTNILMWLDPVKNDMYVSAIVTSNGARTVSSSRPIENLPIRKPFRVGVVFTQKFIEVYINGKLRLTHILSNLPIEITTGKFYGPIIPAMNSVAIANLSYWSHPLSPRQAQATGAPIASSTLFTTPKR
jgi:hypothetical protein